MANESKHKFAAVVLAAGRSRRMKSDRPKVMHALAGRPLIAHVMAALKALKPEKTVIVVAPGMDEVKEAAQAEIRGSLFAEQKKPQGTGDAARCAGKPLAGYENTVLVLCGDAPLVTPETLARALEARESADVVIVGMRLGDPAGYGRIVVDAEGLVEEIVEERDATPEQKKITLCNSGVIAVSGRRFFDLLSKLANTNAAGEYYLTDIVSIADGEGLHCHVVEADAEEVLGINTRAQLADAENAMQRRLRRKAMEEGATLIGGDTIYLSADTKLGRDAVVYPYVVFGPGVSVGDDAEIRSFSHLEGATVKAGASVGPFARLRPGAVIGEEAKVGNFVEVKKSTLHKGAKANHLSYIGDAEVWDGANIGAGTITCNYDGERKYKTVIGKNAFIGSNTALVAPVSVGADAVIGAGSVITKDVESGALGIARALQVNRPGKSKALKRKKG